LDFLPISCLLLKPEKLRQAYPKSRCYFCQNTKRRILLAPFNLSQEFVVYICSIPQFLLGPTFLGPQRPEPASLADAFSDFSLEPEIRLVSIASGSAQVVVEALQRHPLYPNIFLTFGLAWRSIRNLEKRKWPLSRPKGPAVARSPGSRGGSGRPSRGATRAASPAAPPFCRRGKGTDRLR
jgi:hypothetical protein